jgi:predicted nucleic acid-binding protein
MNCRELEEHRYRIGVEYNWDRHASRFFSMGVDKSYRKSLRQGTSAHDLWIAAACLEHNLPLISDDHAFDAIPRISHGRFSE